MPITQSPYLVFWVDDKPYNNDGIIKILEQRTIEVVQVISTKIMQLIINNFFFSLKLINKTIVIVSDMGRHQYSPGWTRPSDDSDSQSVAQLQKDPFNVRAGVDLFQLIYGTYGISNKAIFYVGSVVGASQHINKSTILTENANKWMVSNCQTEIIKAILE